MATQAELQAEAVRRGLVDPQTLLVQEAQRRGLDLPEETVISEPELKETVIPAPVAEAASALNRGAVAIPDFFIDAANTVIDFINLNPALASAGGAIFGPLSEEEGIPSIPRVEDTLEQLSPGFGESGFMDPSLLRTAIQEGGELIPAVSDPAAQAAIKQGFDDGVVSTIKAASDATKERMRNMVAIAKRGINERAFANKNRPADEVGAAVSKRINGIANVNKQAGKQIDKEAKRLAGKNIDLTAARSGFDDALAEADVIVDGKTVDLTGSVFEDVPNVERILNVVKRRLDNLNEAQGAHRFKRWLDNQISSAKLSEGGLSGDAERLLLGVRRGVDDALDSTFEGYRVANERFSETRQILDSFQDAAGKINLDSPNVSKQIGTLSRRLLSNVQSRVRLLDSLEGLDDVASKHGIDISDDVFALARFADELDRGFKPVARTSLNAEVAKAGTQAINEGLGRTATRRALEKGIENLSGINEANALRSIEELLKP